MCVVSLRRPPECKPFLALQGGEAAPPARKPAEPVGSAGAIQDDMLVELVGQDYGMVSAIYLYPILFVCFKENSSREVHLFFVLRVFFVSKYVNNEVRPASTLIFFLHRPIIRSLIRVLSVCDFFFESPVASFGKHTTRGCFRC